MDVYVFKNMKVCMGIYPAVSARASSHASYDLFHTVSEANIRG